MFLTFSWIHLPKRAGGNVSRHFHPDNCKSTPHSFVSQHHLWNSLHVVYCSKVSFVFPSSSVHSFLSSINLRILNPLWNKQASSLYLFDVSSHYSANCAPPRRPIIMYTDIVVCRTCEDKKRKHRSHSRLITSSIVPSRRDWRRWAISTRWVNNQSQNPGNQGEMCAINATLHYPGDEKGNLREKNKQLVRQKSRLDEKSSNF